ncbi:hypothetical protein JVU11DRAFT_9688 [Chiua virens]|nr:hypothetical protein JVU11DRAFT_9688 [Chiua virens]
MDINGRHIAEGFSQFWIFVRIIVPGQKLLPVSTEAMSSNLLSALWSLQTIDYASVSLITVVVYDYILMSSGEIDYIWCMRWNWSFTTFVITRYFGLCLAILTEIAGSTFVHGSSSRCTTLYLAAQCAFQVFLAAADVNMIRYVWAMWNQSRTILWVLLLSYVIDVAVSFAFLGIYYDPTTQLSVIVAQTLGFIHCDYSVNVPPYIRTLYTIPRFVFVSLLLTLTVRFWRSVWTRRMPSQLVRHLVMEVVIYFVLNVLYCITAVIESDFSLDSTSMRILATFCIIFICIAVPRCNINTREMVHGNNVQAEEPVGIFTVLSQLMQANQREDPEVGVGEEIQLELVRDRQNPVQLRDHENSVRNIISTGTSREALCPTWAIVVARSQANKVHLSNRIDKGKRKAEEPLESYGFDRHDHTSNYAHHVHVHVSSSDSETASEFESDSTPSPLMHVPDGIDSDGNASLYQSINGEHLLGDQMDIDIPQHDELDLAYSIKGMYRVLDLISEQGSGGLVDKIIISQDSLEAFINTVSPGAYASMTKVNFKALDNYAIKPVGVYGSKEQIVRFLSQLGAIDDATAAQLLVDPETQLRTQPSLRSGLYIIVTPEQTGASHQIFVLYWPEQTTWDDSATPSVRRNRITFMRYLTKMCDQIVSLISTEHAGSIQWSEEDDENNDDDDVLGIDQDESDRMFTFEVAQTNEQEESVTVREGFKAVSNVISLPETHAEDADPTKLAPKPPCLLFGETVQGFITVECRESRVSHDVFKWRSVTRLRLEGYLMSDRLHLKEQLDEVALDILMRTGLEKRFPDECKLWRRDAIAVRSMSDSSMKKEIEEMSTKLQKALPALERSIFEATLDEVLRIYP